MKFDTVIIGGGLSGLTAGLSLVKKGKKTLIVSSGQSALHFFSGSFELLSSSDEPFKAIDTLPETHPYSRIGRDNLLRLAEGTGQFFASAGVTLCGDEPHKRLTPMGFQKNAWLTSEGLLTIPDGGTLPWKTAAVVNICGFLDFHSSFVCAGLGKCGLECREFTVNLPELEKIRQNPTEMRSTNIAKTLTGEVLDKFAAEIERVSAGCDVVILPAVVGIQDESECKRLCSLVSRPVKMVATFPPSVPGIRIQMQLKRQFCAAGGTYLLGDTVTDGVFEGSRLVGIHTANHGDSLFTADDFVIASGSFFSHGLVAERNRVYEPVFGLDVLASDERGEWFAADVFDNQPYMSFGLSVDNEFRPSAGGAVVENLRAVGSVLGGFNPLKEGCGAGVAILTAMRVAELIS